MIITKESLSTFGLNKYRNFLEDSNGYIELIDETELCDWMNYVLSEHGCTESAVFAIAYDEKHMYAAVTNYDEDEEIVYVDVNKYDYDLDLFASIDAENRLCCYGVIEEFAPGKWKVVE